MIQFRFGVLACMLVPHAALSQQVDSLVDAMPRKLFERAPVTVTATRIETRVFDAPRQVSIVDVESLRRRGVRTMPEALQEVPEITMQRTTLGGGSPILRGLIGQYNLILIDGVRLNTSAWRSGPVQYLNTIDPSLVERIEVVGGPASVLYGSDAIGGVINIITRKAQGDEGTSVETKLFAATADAALTATVEATAIRGAAGILAGASFKRFDDLRGGGSIGQQIPTAYAEWDAHLRIDHDLSTRSSISCMAQSTIQSEVPRFDRIHAGKDVLNVYDPQQRIFGHALFRSSPDVSWLDLVTASCALHHQAECTRIIGAKSFSTEVRDQVRTLTLSASFTGVSRLSEEHTLTFGTEYVQDRIGSNRDTVHLSTGLSAQGPAPFPALSTYHTGACFIQDQWDAGPFLVVAGMRYSRFAFTSGAYETQPTVSGIISQSDAQCGSLHVTYRILDGYVNLFTGVAQGVRAPSASDLGGYGTISNLGIEHPNPQLVSERSLSWETGLKARNESMHATLCVYTTRLNNLIQRNITGRADGLVMLEKTNIASANVTGCNGTFTLSIAAGFILKVGCSWTRGDNITESIPLDRIPPLTGQFSVFHAHDSYWVETLVLGAGAQHRLSPADRIDTRIGPGGTAGYVVLSIRGGTEISRALTLSAGLENVFDQPYKIHGSGLAAPGRNLYLGVSMTL